MKFLSFHTTNGERTWGATDGEYVHDLGPTGAKCAGSLREAIAAGALPSEVTSITGTRYREDEIHFLPVIDDPAKVLCVGLNYRSHLEETGRELPAEPTVFIRYPDTQIGHERPAIKPAVTQAFDYEGELAVVIGKPTHGVAEFDAMDHVAGYSIYDELTARDWQRNGAQWTAGKNFPGTGAFGPYFVPAADIADVNSLELETRVNGDLRQKGVLSDLFFTIPRLISYISTFTPLAPGDVIVTGTPGGVGVFMEPSGLLNAGDVVEVSISGLGTLRNTVVDEQAPERQQ